MLGLMSRREVWQKRNRAPCPARKARCYCAVWPAWAIHGRRGHRALASSVSAPPRAGTLPAARPRAAGSNLTTSSLNPGDCTGSLGS